MSLAFNVFRKTVTRSTMNDAKIAINNGYGHGTVCVAERQTEGRGRIPGRIWENSNVSLLFSIVIEKKTVKSPYPLTQLMALSLCEHLETVYHLRPQIKWPNDVLLSNAKLSGILVETYLDFYIAGMGINMIMDSGRNDFSYPACALADFVKGSLDAEQELYGIVEKLDRIIRANPPVSEIERRLAYMDETVPVVSGGMSQKQKIYGQIYGLQRNGGLIIRTDDKKFITVYSGEVEFS